MTILVYDGSWPGLLTAIFECYEFKFDEVKICTEERYQPDVFSDKRGVITDNGKFSRLLAGLEKKLSRQAIYNLYSCFLSGIDGIEATVLTFIRLTFSAEASIEQAYGHQAVLKVSQVAKMVYREKHRMEAFVRFELTADGIFYAVIEPDFNVIPLIADHFKKRYADQHWLIYDVRRGYGIYYDLQAVSEITLDRSAGKGAGEVFDGSEQLYQHLWMDYFKSVNIAARKNTKLHLRHVPKRYWRHLTEKFQ